MILKVFLLIFTFVYVKECQSQSLWSCNVPLCASAPAGNGCSGATTCYSFNTSSGSSVCAPAPPCSLFDTCTSSGSGCPSTKSVCVVNACCSTPVCIPLSLIDMCLVPTSSTTAVTPASSTSATSTCVSLPGAWVLSTYNLVTLGDLSTSSDVENRTIVCGSLVSSSSANFAIHVVSSTSTASIYNIEVNGQIVSGNALNVNAGSFGLGTNYNYTIVANGVVNYVLNGRQVNMNGGNQGANISVDTSLAATCSSVTNAVQSLSTYLTTLTNTTGNNISIPTSQSGPLNFYVNTVDANGFAVFNLDGNTVLNNVQVQQIEIIVSSNVSSALQLVVLNLYGTSISFAQGNFVGTWLNSVSTGRAQTIWNLPQATSLTISRNWMGALLAPNATVTASVNIDGAAAVHSLTTTAELHNPPLIVPNCISSSATTTTASNTQCPIPSTGAGSFSAYNLITLGDLSTASDVENRTIVCGSLVSSSSANFAIHVVSSTSTASIYNIEVNGQIVSGNALNVNAGSFGLGTNYNYTIVANGVVNYVVNGRQVNMNGGNQGGNISVDTNLTAKCAGITNDIQKLSAVLAQLPNVTGNNVSIPTSQSGPLNFYVNAVDSYGVAVFNLDGNTVLNNVQVQQIEIIVSSNVSSALQLVVINLYGTSISFAQGNFVGTWLTTVSTGRAQTIWNLPQATSLTISRNWMGALLAPNATVTASVNIDGAAAVHSLTTTAELHNPPIIIPACL